MKNNFFLYTLCFITTQYITADNTETLHRYLWANYNHFAGNIPHAQDWYTKLFSANNSVYTYKGYLNFLTDTKQFKQIAELIPTLEKNLVMIPIFNLFLPMLWKKPNKSNKLITLSLRSANHLKHIQKLHSAQHKPISADKNQKTHYSRLTHFLTTHHVDQTILFFIF